MLECWSRDVGSKGQECILVFFFFLLSHVSWGDTVQNALCIKEKKPKLEIQLVRQVFDTLLIVSCMSSVHYVS